MGTSVMQSLKEDVPFGPPHKVADAIAAAGYALLTDYNSEASGRKFVNDGYTVLNFWSRKRIHPRQQF
jgi:hypothetical protein